MEASDAPEGFLNMLITILVLLATVSYIVFSRSFRAWLLEPSISLWTIMSVGIGGGVARAEYGSTKSVQSVGLMFAVAVPLLILGWYLDRKQESVLGSGNTSKP